MSADGDEAPKKAAIVGVVGRTNAGKSTLVKCILGMLRPSAGRIALRCSAAAIHQELNLINDLSVYENLFIGEEIKRGAFLSKGKDLAKANRLG